MPTPAEYDQIVLKYAAQYGINPSVAVLQLRRESDTYRPDVVNGPFVGGAGERGIAQFTPATWADWGEGPHTNAYNVDASMTAWGRYMSHLLNKYAGNYEKALQGYNGGPGNVDRGTVSQGAQRYAREILESAGSAGPANTAGPTAGPAAEGPITTQTPQILSPDFNIPAWLPLVGVAFLLIWLADD